MRSIFSKSPSPTRSTPPQSPLRHTFSESLMEENLQVAQSMISKWDASDSKSYCNISSLFSAENRSEAKQYLNSVEELRQAMHYFVTGNTGAEKLGQAQKLMQTAMKRLEKEFYQMLKSNRDCLDPESVSTHSYSSRAASPSRSSFSDFGDDTDDESIRPESVAISDVERASIAAVVDLKAIADCMISAGYAKECVKIYKTVRKSIIDEALYNLGAERLTLSQLQKMDWEVMELKIKNWTNAAKVAVKTLYYGERLLCDQVFSVTSLRESVFTEISKDGAISLFGFAENVAKCKNTPEKMFRILDLYETISDLWPEIDSIFIFESTSAVRQTAVNSLIKLAEAVRAMLTEFETAIQKDASKSPILGGGVHPLTRYVMNFVTFLTDYSGILSDILADTESTAPSPLPASYYGSPIANDAITSPVSAKLAWLILITFCKLDSKASLYKDVALSYLFLANNLQYVVGKVKSSNLRFLLGEEWLANHESKLQKYAANYERMGWSKVIGSLPEVKAAGMSIDLVKDHFQKFNAAFEETYKKQSSWIIPDPKFRDEIKLSLAKRVMAVYAEFYGIYGGVGLRKQTWNESIVRFTPDDLGNYLSDLFYGTGSSGSVSSNSSHGGRSSH